MLMERADSTRRPAPHSISAVYTWIQRLCSWRHYFWYRIGERVRWSRGAFVETPAGVLTDVPLEQGERIAALREAYQVRFEARANAATALKNYEYLDILAQLAAVVPQLRRRGGTLHDAGCASFWYAAALDRFFAPSTMVGVEVEGYRLFKDGHTRIDYAQGYLGQLPHARFEVADYSRFEASADVITAWFPFVSATAILAWRLPLSLLAPRDLFRRVHANLAPDGIFVMINHGVEEAASAAQLCREAGLKRLGEHLASGPLVRHRHRPAVASCWVST